MSVCRKAQFYWRIPESLNKDGDITVQRNIHNRYGYDHLIFIFIHIDRHEKSELIWFEAGPNNVAIGSEGVKRTSFYWTRSCIVRRWLNMKYEIWYYQSYFPGKCWRLFFTRCNTAMRLVSRKKGGTLPYSTTQQRRFIKKVLVQECCICLILMHTNKMYGIAYSYDAKECQ